MLKEVINISNSLKHQFKSAIEASFIAGADKHAIKCDTGLGDHRIYSYADRKNLIDTAMGFVNFLKKEYSDIRYIKQIKPKHCLAFLESKVNSCTQGTIDQYATRLQKLSRIVDRYYKIYTNYRSDVPKSNKSSKLRTEVMARKDFLLICAAGTDCPSKRALLLAGETALRVTSLVRLKVCDVNFENMTLFIYKDKGARSRTIPLNNTALNYLMKYCENKSKIIYLHIRIAGSTFHLIV